MSNIAPSTHSVPPATSPQAQSARRRRNSLSRAAIAAAVVAATGLAGLAGTAGIASAAANSDRLNPGETLGSTQRLVSADGQYTLVMQGDGNLVEYAPGGRPIWATGTNRAGSNVEMQTDGNLVVYAYPGHVPTWASGTSGIPNLHLEVQTDANQVLYTPAHTARWATGNITDRNNIGQVKYTGYISMRDAGWPDSEWGALDQLWNGESGWRWNAANPSGAYGIPQALPGSKMGANGSDWHDNPATQIRWGLDYIRNHPGYGSPSAAWSFWQKHRWY